MARSKHAATLQRILDAAAQTFLEAGYQGARMEQIARRAHVAAGTPYLYVDAKEALFRLVLMRAFGDPLPAVETLPFRGSVGPDLVEWVWQRLLAASPFARLRAAAAKGPEPEDAIGEFEGVVREVWDWQSRHWQAIELIERCARDWPELNMLFYAEFRRGLLGLGASWLEKRMRTGRLRRYPDAATAARVIAENIAFFAMHRHIRPDSKDLDETMCRETVVLLLRNAFAPGGEEKKGLKVPRTRSRRSGRKRLTP